MFWLDRITPPGGLGINLRSLSIICTGKMHTLKKCFSFFFFFFLCLLFPHKATGVITCASSFCHDAGPDIQFPFRLKNRQPSRCGYPGFDLSCTNRSLTVLNLRNSGEFAVRKIDYTEQRIFLSDPEFCIAKRFLDFNISDSIFRAVYSTNLTFFNCSANVAMHLLEPVYCLSGVNYTVVVTQFESVGTAASNWCRKIKSVTVPVQWSAFLYGYPSAVDADLELAWDTPDCRFCEEQNGVCGFRSDTDRSIGCVAAGRSGIPRRAKYVIVICAVIPGVVCIMGVACYICTRLRGTRGFHHENRDRELPPSSITPQPLVVLAGLDGSTIDSYPKTVLGESRRLPKPNDATCPICLSEYLPKETLRTIPDCNHYFHAQCVDEWLKLNATCPLCRNSPDGSARITPSSSIISPSSSISTSTTSTFLSSS